MAGHDNIPTLAEQVSRVPTQPGCYLWKDAKGDVIYVGKAKNLRSRMRQYVTLQDASKDPADDAAGGEL